MRGGKGETCEVGARVDEEGGDGNGTIGSVLRDKSCFQSMVHGGEAK